MFDTYIAVDPSVWWNRYALNATIADAVQAPSAEGRKLFVAASHEASSAERFQAFISEADQASSVVELDYAPMPEESHATLFHPAAMRALRVLFPADATAGE
jgi:predicted alpha/beta superfamily hydrolase